MYVCIQKVVKSYIHTYICECWQATVAKNMIGPALVAKETKFEEYIGLGMHVLYMCMCVDIYIYIYIYI